MKRREELLQMCVTRRVRRSRWASLISLFAMVLQLLFATEHAAAMAVAAAKGGADGTPQGFLEICTAQGLLRIPAPAGTGLDTQQTPRHSGGEGCAVCHKIAVAGAADTSLDGPPVVDNPHLLQVAIVRPADLEVRKAGFRRAGSTRGPPLI